MQRALKKGVQTIFVLLDRSGSMQIRWGDTVGLVNTYVDKLAAKPEVKEARLIVATFDTAPGAPMVLNPFGPGALISGAGLGMQGTLRAGQSMDFRIWQNTTVGNYSMLNMKELTPRGGTPLYDAVAMMCAHPSVVEAETGIAVIITDGEENSSQHASQSTAKGLLEQLRGKGWLVEMLGADFENMAQGAAVGNLRGHTQSVNTADAYANNMASSTLARKSALYASGVRGQSLDTTEEEHAAMSGGKSNASS